MRCTLRHFSMLYIAYFEEVSVLTSTRTLGFFVQEGDANNSDLWLADAELCVCILRPFGIGTGRHGNPGSHFTTIFRAAIQLYKEKETAGFSQWCRILTAKKKKGRKRMLPLIEEDLDWKRWWFNLRQIKSFFSAFMYLAFSGRLTSNSTRYPDDDGGRS